MGMTYFDLGPYSRKVTTSSPDAQLWFDRGLNWLFGFNHAEGLAVDKEKVVGFAEPRHRKFADSYSAGSG